MNLNNKIIIALRFDTDPNPPASAAPVPQRVATVKLISRYRIGKNGKVEKVFGENLARIA